MKTLRTIALGTMAALATLAASVACALPLMAAAQTCPGKPIKLIVPAAAGPSTSIIAPELAQRMGGALGQTMIVENIAGQGVETKAMSLDEYAAFTGQELAKWAPVVKASGARAD